MIKRQCENCFFVRGGKIAGLTCHFGPPSCIPAMTKQGAMIVGQFPPVKEDADCGKHKFPEEIKDSFLVNLNIAEGQK